MNLRQCATPDGTTRFMYITYEPFTKHKYNNLMKREILHIFIKTKWLWLMIWLTVICLNGTYKDIAQGKAAYKVFA